MTNLLYKEEVYTIIGAAMEVYNELGPGFLEAVYQEAMEIEMEMRGIPFKPQQELNIHYKGRRLKKIYVPDLYCYDKIVVDLKALDRLTTAEEAQLLNYLKGTRSELGLLINFGARHRLEYKRMVRTLDRSTNKDESPRII